ncbi:MAG TPA: hypothetical protein VFX58_01565 [Chitinophagaceae bacterium]|nr:hypothetical protein [Chitinophagaceae bacterium]
MRPFEHLDQEELLDRLAHVTARYIKLFTGGFKDEDFIASRELLHLLHLELDARNKNNSKQVKSGDNHGNGYYENKKQDQC